MTFLINEAAAAVATAQVRSPRPLRSLIAGLAWLSRQLAS